MGLLSYENEKFYFVAANANDEAAAMKAGLKMNRGELRCSTRDFNKALHLRRYANKDAEAKLKSHFITMLVAPEYISYPDHQAPRTWQIESAWHMLTRTPSYCADEAGMGKTISAILAMNSSPGKTLIICPPYLRFNWLKELEAWGECDTVSLIESAEDDFRSNVLVLPDSLLTNEAIQVILRRDYKFKWLFVDEAHRYKNGNSQRSKALFGADDTSGDSSICAIADNPVFLSGTPIPNGRPIELYPLLSRVAPEAILHRGLQEYWKTFCGGRTITRYERGQPIVHRDYQGSSNLEHLKKELTTSFMIRHEKKNHLHELGAKTRQLIFVDAPKNILAFEKKHLANIELDNAALGDIATYRKDVGVSKIKFAIEYISELLDSSDEKIIVSAHHIEVVEALVKGLKKYGALKIRGGMKAKLKQETVELFQEHDGCRVIVGNTLSMGLGNTLTRAALLVSVEPDWTPGVNEQMEDRIHRISQTKHVVCKYLVLRNSLDERMLRRALEKQENIEAVMNRKALS